MTAAGDRTSKLKETVGTQEVARLHFPDVEWGEWGEPLARKMWLQLIC